MRIDGPNPVSQAGLEPAAREVKPVHVPQAAPAIQDHVETHQRPAVSPTNVLVEMQPGNIVVYKFIDEASGRLIQQIPSEQMLSLSSTDESPKESKNRS
jgi:hypothetical protein